MLHKADASEIKEITISALAQNPATAHLAQAYQDIANIIKKAMRPYLRYLAIDDKTERIDSEGLYEYIAERFVKNFK